MSHPTHGHSPHTPTSFSSRAIGSNNMTIPPSVGQPIKTIGFNPTTTMSQQRHSPHLPITHTVPMTIPNHHPPTNHSNGHPHAEKLDLFRSSPSMTTNPIPHRIRQYGFEPNISPTPSSRSLANTNRTTTSPFDGSTAAHLTPPPTAAVSAASSSSISPFQSTQPGSVSSTTSSLSALLHPAASHTNHSTSSSSTFLQPSGSSQPQLASSVPLSMPSFRRAMPVAALEQGLDMNTQEATNQTDAMKKQPVAPRIQNFSQLGQQIKQHLQSATTNSNTNMNTSEDTVSMPSQPTLQKSSSTLSMVDADQLPEISSPQPNTQLQFAFDSPIDDEELTDSHQMSNFPRLNFDSVQINSKDQILGAIPVEIRHHTPPQPFPNSNSNRSLSPLQPPPSSNNRWLTSSHPAPLSSSAPSHMPSWGLGFGPGPFVQGGRRDSGSSVASTTSNSGANSTAGPSSKKTSLSFATHRRELEVHTPTTIASEDANGTVGSLHLPGGDGGTEVWSAAEDDEMEDGEELEGMISHQIHGDGSSCSLSSCSSCSDESSDFSANLEDDFDVRLTFPHGSEARPEDEIDQALKQRLNQTRREHHTNRHLIHRRRKARLILKRQKEEARLRGGEPLQHAESDEIKSNAGPPVNEEDIISVGSYTHGERQQKIQRYLEKRRRRVWSKKILYSCRKNFADKRPRIGGRFVKVRDDGSEALSAESFSLSSSPTATAAHMPTGFLPYVQHMHGFARGHGIPLSMTAFSLPLANYAHTTFSPASAHVSPSASQRTSFSQQHIGGSLQAMAPTNGGTLSFLKQEQIPQAHSIQMTSGLSAALAPAAAQARFMNSAPPPTTTSTSSTDSATTGGSLQQTTSLQMPNSPPLGTHSAPPI